VQNEQLLATYVATGSSAALDGLVRGNQNLLHHILKGFAYADEPYEDLLQVANLGLIKAAQRYDPARGVRFSTYATAIVDGELRHHLRDSLLMRQPRWVKKVYQEIQAMSLELLHKLGRPPELAELAAALNINEAGILEVTNLYARIALHSGNEPVTAEEFAAGADRNVVHALRMESFALPIEDRITLYGALDKLSSFQRRLIYLLFFKDLTQTEAAHELGLTQKKVSRESIKALGKLRQLLGPRPAERPTSVAGRLAER
jgi:RNA polymerase sigma-B factor